MGGDTYNTGAQRAILSVVEQSGQSTVTVAAGAEGTPSLTAALEDTLICVQGRDALGVSHDVEVRLRPDRSDDATAAYVLQNWMQHLDPAWSSKRGESLPTRHRHPIGSRQWVQSGTAWPGRIA